MGRDEDLGGVYVFQWGEREIERERYVYIYVLINEDLYAYFVRI